MEFLIKVIPFLHLLGKVPEKVFLLPFPGRRKERRLIGS